MAAGVALLVAGVILVIASYVPIPYVEDAPRVEARVTATPGLVAVNMVLIDETFKLDAGQTRTLCRSFPPGTTLSITIKVLSGGSINFWVMDEPELRVFEAGGSFNYYVFPSRRGVIEQDTTWSPPSNKLLCLVFDNKLSTGTKTVYAKITFSYEELTYVTRTHAYTVHEPAVRFRTLGYLQTLGVVVLVAGAILVIASWYVSAQQKPAGAQH
jgi:hypothetical protein